MKNKIEKLLYKSPLYALAVLHRPITNGIILVIFFGLVLAAILIIAAATIINLVLEGISLIHNFISDKTHSAVPKALLTTLVILFYAQFSSTFHNPISDCFKSLMNKLGISFNTNALVSSLISMTIFIFLYIFQDQAKKTISCHTTGCHTTGQQNVFFCLLSSATGPISYATNLKLPASILLGLAPSFVMALMLISRNQSTNDQVEPPPSSSIVEEMSKQQEEEKERLVYVDSESLTKEYSKKNNDITERLLPT